MLWEYIYRHRVALSLSFFVLFSLVNIIWQKNLFTNTSVYVNKIVEQTNYIFKSFISFPFTFIQRISEYSELKQKYEKALEEIEKYKSQKEQLEQLLIENEKLRRMMNFEPLQTYPEEKAQVLGIRLSSVTPRIIINKGRRHNIEPFMPVIGITTDENQNPIRAVVGIIAKVQENSSIVQPIQHPQSKIGVRIDTTNQWGILEGSTFSFDRLRLKYISSYVDKKSVYFFDTYQEIQKSRIVTSGNEGIFPPNIPIGRVISDIEQDEHNFSIAYVEPYIKIDSLDYVIVLIKKPEDWSNYIHEENEPLKTILDSNYIPQDLMKNYQELISKDNNKEVKPSENQETKKEATLIEKQQEPKRKLINPLDPLQ
ncbi:MAG: rod shape-determining protein MreC [Leptospiraceae bacterium]|nr:rod shape-determining protein MreC [Leptospiraceae bacterium]MDW7977091.1 rod shape-determining protein MreC [Leptospiraceae bacterium]